jgi:MFS family permease
MIPNWLSQILDNYANVASLASALLAIVGSFSSVFATRFAYRRSLRKGRSLALVEGNLNAQDQGEFVGSCTTRDTAGNVPAYTIARERVRERINEANEALNGQKSVAWWSSFASVLLSVGQYIVGGLLASSFVQSSLTPTLIGILGLIVLFASICKQHFHPEVNAANAKGKAGKFRDLVRTSEDDLAVLDAKSSKGYDHSDEMIALMKTLTQRMSEIEDGQNVPSKKLILVNGK